MPNFSLTYFLVPSRISMTLTGDLKRNMAFYFNVAGLKFEEYLRNLNGKVVPPNSRLIGS